MSAIADIREQIPNLADTSDEELVALIVTEVRVKRVVLALIISAHLSSSFVTGSFIVWEIADGILLALVIVVVVVPLIAVISKDAGGFLRRIVRW